MRAIRSMSMNEPRRGLSTYLGDDLDDLDDAIMPRWNGSRSRGPSYHKIVTTEGT